MDIPVGRTTIGFMEPADSGIMRIGQVGQVLRRHVWIILGLAVIGGVIAVGFAESLPKSYTSSASLAVEGDTFSIPELQGAIRGSNSPDPMPLVRTELRALTSPKMLRQVIGQLNLVQNPEFNPTLRPPTMFGRLKAGFNSLLPGKHTNAPPDANALVLREVERSLNSFQDDRSLVINVSFTAYDRALAAQFINTLINDYFSDRSHQRANANHGAQADMTQRIAQVRGDLAHLEQQMRDLRSKSGVVGLMRTGTVGQQQLEELATAVDRASVDRATAEANYDRAAAVTKHGDPSALASVLDSETITRLRDQEGAAASRLATLSSSHGDLYPGVRSARSDLAAIKGQIADQARRIVSSLGAQLQVARAHEADVKQQLAQARDAAVKAQNTEAQLKEFQADADSQRRVLQQLLIQAQQVVGPTGQAANNIPDVRLLSGAVPSDVPSAPNMKTAGGMGLVGGAVLGCLLAFIRGVGTVGFANADGLATIANISNVVTLPRTRPGALVKRVTEEPGGAEAEALRLLRARLRSSANAPRNVVFTALACDPAIIAAAFARVAAMGGERVLLAEGGLGKPGIGKLLGLRDGAFDRVLRGDEDWHDVVEADPDSPLDVLASSEPAGDQESLLASVALQNLLMEAREDYSMVVIAAAGDENAAVGTLAQRTDATVLVVDGRRDSQAAVRELAQHLAGLSRSPVLGLLVMPA